MAVRRDAGPCVRPAQAVACTIAAVVLAMLLTANPTASEEEVITYGIGKHPCSVWLQAKTSASDRRANLAWMHGYLSAAAVYGPDQTLILGTTDNAIMASVDTYCGEHPRQSVLDAAAWLVRRLVKMKNPAARW